MSPFPEEFRRNVVKLAGSIKEARKNCWGFVGFPPETLSNWSSQLRRRNQLLELKKEVLRRAPACLSQVKVKLGRSPQ
jgi:transposase-like protein